MLRSFVGRQSRELLQKAAKRAAEIRLGILVANTVCNFVLCTHILHAIGQISTNVKVQSHSLKCAAPLQLCLENSREVGSLAQPETTCCHLQNAEASGRWSGGIKSKDEHVVTFAKNITKQWPPTYEGS